MYFKESVGCVGVIRATIVYVEGAPQTSVADNKDKPKNYGDYWKILDQATSVLVLVYTQEGSLWSIVLRCDDHTGIFTCDGCARDSYFYVPAETQSYVIKLSCSSLKESPCRQRGLNSEPLGYNDLESATLSTAPARHIN